MNIKLTELTCRAGTMDAGCDTLVEDFLVVPPVGSDRATLAGDLVPGTIGILESDALTVKFEEFVNN